MTTLVFMPPHYTDDQRHINGRLFSCLNIFYGVPSRATLRRTSANLRSTVKSSTTSIYSHRSYSQQMERAAKGFYSFDSITTYSSHVFLSFLNRIRSQAVY